MLEILYELKTDGTIDLTKVWKETGIGSKTFFVDWCQLRDQGFVIGNPTSYSEEIVGTGAITPEGEQVLKEA